MAVIREFSKLTAFLLIIIAACLAYCFVSNYFLQHPDDAEYIFDDSMLMPLKDTPDRYNSQGVGESE
jgi:hypothetical protein